LLGVLHTHSHSQNAMGPNRETSPLGIESLIWQSGALSYDQQIMRHSKSRLDMLEQHLSTVAIPKHRVQKLLELL